MKTIEIDIADETLNGENSLVDRIEYAINNYTNVVPAGDYDGKFVADKYCVTVTVDLIEGWEENAQIS